MAAKKKEKSAKAAKLVKAKGFELTAVRRKLFGKFVEVYTWPKAVTK